MPDVSLHALACDLLGGDVCEQWDERDRPSGTGERSGWPTQRVERVTVGEAKRSCPRGEVMAARKGKQEVAVCRLEDGRVFVVPDRCPHDGGRLSDGFVQRDRLVCGRHGWEFDPATGQRTWPRPK